MNREERLREARTTEAMKKGYTGMEGKFSVVARRLGQPILQQGSSCYEQTFLEDPFAAEFADDSLPTMEEDESSYEIGLHFDGLSRGANLSIFVHHYNKEIVVEFEGRKVYQEIAGELERFAPGVWEERIESFYKSAKLLERQQKPLERKRMIEEADKKRKEIFDDFKSKWGLA